LRNEQVVFFDSKEVMDASLDHLYRKKIIKNILEINDKSIPVYVRIVISIEKKQLINILNRHFKYLFKVRQGR
jgi:DNA gyrase/topoisomerase IV subunit A